MLSTLTWPSVGPGTGSEAPACPTQSRTRVERVDGACWERDCDFKVWIQDFKHGIYQWIAEGNNLLSCCSPALQLPCSVSSTCSPRKSAEREISRPESEYSLIVSLSQTDNTRVDMVRDTGFYSRFSWLNGKTYNMTGESVEIIWNQEQEPGKQ